MRCNIRLLLLASLVLIAGGCSKDHGFEYDEGSRGRLAPVRKGANEYLFQFHDPYMAAEEVALIGNFRQNGKRTPRFTMEREDGLFQCTIQLDPGDYYYKFLINNSLLFTPPLNHLITIHREMHNAGRIIVPNPDYPYIAALNPPHESTVSNLEAITLRIGGNHSKVDKHGIRAILNDRSIEITYDPETRTASAPVSNLRQGEYDLYIYFQDRAGDIFLEHRSAFFLYTEPAGAIRQRPIRGHTAYRVLIPFFGPESKHASATIADLIEKLDYINDGKTGGNDLGVPILIVHNVMPAADAYHTQIINYRAVANQIGSLFQLERLARACAQRNIQLILHYNAAYISNRHSFFQDAYDNPASRMWNLFFFLNDQGTSYHAYANDPALPRLDTNSEYLTNYLISNVWDWIRRGVNGFYFEHAGLLSERWVDRVRRSIYQYRSNVLMAADAYGSPEYVNQLFQNKFNAAVQSDIGQHFMLAAAGANPRAITAQLTNFAAAIPENAVFFRNSSKEHDIRPGTFLGSTKKHAHFLGLFLTSGGIPVINWGDEIAVESVKPPFQDTPPQMRWATVDAMRPEPSSLLNLTRRLIQLREEYPELNTDLHEGRSVLRWSIARGNGYDAFIRQIEDDRFFVGILVDHTEAENASPEFGSANLLPGRYTGRLVSEHSPQPHQAFVEEGTVGQLALPLDSSRHFMLFLFSRR